MRSLVDGHAVPPDESRDMVDVAVPKPCLEQIAHGSFALATDQCVDPGVGRQQFVPVERDFGPAENDADFRAYRLKCIDQFEGRRAVPQVDRKGNDIGIPFEEQGEDTFLGLVRGEFPDFKTTGEVGAVGRQVGERQARVYVLAV